LNWQGQPVAQLQLEIWMPFMRQSTYAMTRSFCGDRVGERESSARSSRWLEARRASELRRERLDR
jgi:hypothetical protein